MKLKAPDGIDWLWVLLAVAMMCHTVERIWIAHLKAPCEQKEAK